MKQHDPSHRWAAWLSGSNTAAAEIVRDLGYGAVVLDIEHGSFDLADLERFVPFLRAIGLRVLAKVLAPERGPIQQALDFGADVVVIPHVENLAHAVAVCAYGKFPPRGDRSFAGGRTARYSGFDDVWVAAQDAKTQVYPMIEDAGLSAAIYTQTTDVEVEVNGLMTYDRALVKMDANVVAAANKAVYTPAGK